MAAKDDVLTLLIQVGSTMEAQFPAHVDRLHQLRSALRTAVMAVEHLYDEDLREQDLIARVSASRAAADRHGHQLKTPLEA